MNHRICSIFLTLMLLLPIAALADPPVKVLKTGQTIVYTTNDDGDIQAGKAWATPRFTDNGDGTVSDNETGLMWMKDVRCFQGTTNSTWNGAFDYIDAINNGTYPNCDGGYDDWTMPNVLELQSLTDASIPYPNTIAQPHPFPQVNPGTAWSSSSWDFQQFPQAYVVSLSKGYSSSFTKANASALAWPVRVEDPTKLTLPKTGQTTSYHIGDDGDMQRGVSILRFVDHQDGTVTDTVTGLMWLKDMSCLGNRTWTNSFPIIENLNAGQVLCTDYIASYADWRLPNKNEIASIIDLEEANQDWPWRLALPNGHPFIWTNEMTKFWTSNTYAGDNAYQNTAWSYYMNTGYSERYRSKDVDSLGVWAVRGGEVQP